MSQLTSAQLSEQSKVTKQYIQSLTKKAVDKVLSHINLKGEKFSFAQVQGIGGRGLVYAYTQVAKNSAKPKRRVNNNVALNPLELPVIADLNKFTTDEKQALVSFYHTSKHPLSHIAQALIMAHGSSGKASSLEAKIKRWSKAFKEKGRAGLEDERGGKAFKADLELVQQAILGAGDMHNTSIYSFYCHLYATRHGLSINYKNPTSDISESAFNRTVKHLINTRQLVRDYLRLGQDAFVYAEPIFGRNWEYPNQQWEVDATPLDIMAKVPLKEGIRNYSKKEATEEYHLAHHNHRRGGRNAMVNNVVSLAHYRIVVNGEDVTAAIKPLFIRLTISDNDKDEADELTITVSAKFSRPAYKDEIKVFLSNDKDTPPQFLGLFLVQKTTIKNKRQLTIIANGADYSGELKERRHVNYENTTLGAVASDIAARHGLAVRTNISQPVTRFEQINESDLHFLNRLAKEHNAIFNIKNNILYFTKGSQEVPKVTISGGQCDDLEITHSNQTLYKSAKASYQNTKLNKVVSVIVGEGTPQLYKQGHFQNDDEARTYAANALARANKGLINGTLTKTGQVLFAGSELTLDGEECTVKKVRHTVENLTGWKLSAEFDNKD